MHIIRLTGLLLLTCFIAGCASIGTRQRDGAGRPFAGVRDDAHYLAHPSEADQPGLQFMNIFDLPFSALVDTLLLPYDLSVAK
jgi:uncharacterized protein YceK